MDNEKIICKILEEFKNQEFESQFDESKVHHEDLGITYKYKMEMYSVMNDMGLIRGANIQKVGTTERVIAIVNNAKITNEGKQFLKEKS